MFSWSTRGAKRRTAVLTILAAAAVCGSAVAAAPIKDAKLGAYARWGADKVNIRLDKVAHVKHVEDRKSVV